MGCLFLIAYHREKQGDFQYRSYYTSKTIAGSYVNLLNCVCRVEYGCEKGGGYLLERVAFLE
jgi:hypothetical protein